MRSFVLALMLLSVCTHVYAADYKIEKVKGNIYRLIDDRHRSVFLVTDEGILLTDPLNESAALWLKNKLKERFDVPVKYVIYSHNHSDHIYGAEVFQDTGVLFISHALARQDIAVTKAKTVIPDVSFEDKMTIHLGGSEVELRYHGANDGRGSISMLFKPEKVLFVVDWIVIGRMPWQKLWSYDIQGMINATREVMNLDFDTFVGGHAEVGTRQDVQNYLNYLEALYAEVVHGIHAGMTLEQLQQTISLDEYSHLAHFEEWLPKNIEGVYKRLMDESGMGWRPDLK